MTITRKVIAVFSDKHAGSKYGLMPPDVQLLDDTGPEPRTWTPTQSAIQREWLTPNYSTDVPQVFDIAGKDDVVLVYTGDLTHGTYFHDGLVSTRMADQITIAIANFVPWYTHRNLKRVFIVQGTAVHEMGEGSAPIIATEHLSKRYPKVRTEYARHYLLDVGGKLLDAAHHGPTAGRRVWLKGDEVRRYTRNILLDGLIHGEPMPDMLERAHVHEGIEPERVRVGAHSCEAWVQPSYCGMDDHALKISKSAYRLTCGLTVVEVIEGEPLRIHPLWHSLDLRQKVTV